MPTIRCRALQTHGDLLRGCHRRRHAATKQDRITAELRAIESRQSALDATLDDWHAVMSSAPAPCHDVRTWVPASRGPHEAAHSVWAGRDFEQASDLWHRDRLVSRSANQCGPDGAHDVYNGVVHRDHRKRPREWHHCSSRSPWKQVDGTCHL